jgi:hypothetical protein
MQTYTAHPEQQHDEFSTDLQEELLRCPLCLSLPEMVHCMLDWATIDTGAPPFPTLPSISRLSPSIFLLIRCCGICPRPLVVR